MSDADLRFLFPLRVLKVLLFQDAPLITSAGWMSLTCLQSLIELGLPENCSLKTEERAEMGKYGFKLTFGARSRLPDLVCSLDSLW